MGSEIYYNNASTADITAMTLICSAATPGIISDFGISRGNGSTASQYQVDIVQSSITLATGFINHPGGTASTRYGVTFSEGDYSSILASGSFQIVLTRNSGDIEVWSRSDSFSGSLFSFASQTVVQTASSPTIEFTEVAGKTVTPSALSLTLSQKTPTVSLTVAGVGREGESTIYVNNGGTWTEIETFEDFDIKLKQNQVSEFHITLADIEASEKAYIKEFAEVIFLYGTTLIFKGRIQKVTYKTTYECEIEGYGKEAILLDRGFIKSGDERVQYTNTSAQTIANELLSKNSDGAAPWIMESDGLGIFTTDYGTISMRYEYANRLSSEATLADAMDYEWAVNQSADFFTDYFQLASLLPTTTRATVSQGTFAISGASANCSQTSHTKDITNVANNISGLGYGDGVNQTKTSTYNASATFTTLGANISSTATTITLTDASSFATTGEVRIMEERITYSGKSGNNLTGCTRGTSSTTAREHKTGVFVEKYIAAASAEAGSSIADNGFMDDTVTNRDIIDVATLELTVSRELLKRLNPIVRIKLIPDEPEETVGTFKIGDLVTIVDSESDLNDDFRIVSMNFFSDYGDLGIELECSNKTLTFIEQMARQRKEAEALGRYMQGSTNIYAINESENCDSDTSLNLRFFIPNEAIAINKVLLNFKLEDYRSYSKATFNSKNTSGSLTSPKSIWNEGDTVDTNSSSYTISTVVPNSPDVEVVTYDFDGAFTSKNLGAGYSETRLGQKVTISNRVISKLTFRLSKEGSPTGNVTATVRRAADDVIMASGTILASSLGVGTAMHEFLLDTPITVNEEVYLSVEYTGGDVTNRIQANHDDGTQVGAPGEAYDYDGTWTIIAGDRDVLMKITYGAFNGCVCAAQIHNASGATDTFKYKIRNDTTSTDLYDLSGGFSAGNQTTIIDAGLVFDTTEVTAGDILQLIVYDGVIGTATAETRAGWIELIVVSSPLHGHAQDYGIQEQPLTSPSIDLYTGEDGGSMTLKDTYTTNQTELDITSEVSTIGAGKWVNVRFDANKNMRIEANAYIQIFIESK